MAQSSASESALTECSLFMAEMPREPMPITLRSVGRSTDGAEDDEARASDADESLAWEDRASNALHEEAPLIGNNN